LKQFFAIASLALSLASFTAHAADPTPPITPDADVKEKMQGSQSDGALKVEKRHAVSPEALREQDEIHTEKTQRASVSEPHLFGLHAGLGVPHPINYGLNYVHSSRLFSAEISTGSFGATVSNVNAKIENTEIALRWHPWAGSFFLGTLLGTQKINGERTDTYLGVTATAKVEIKSTYLTPHVGWMWGGQSTGFFYNFEVGVQFPTNPTTNVSSDAPAIIQLTPDYIKNQQDVQDQAEKIGKSVFPFVALFKFGYLF
jgi:hypothetical protein